ncbi:hypothetical protein H112_00062 [Trichophyton rubrum D6]|uniref:Uncharacterized protein n=5 Tax=Trichophyton TaxID=5550 RepID=A0A178F890_TRIRU|nr:uncharacterized protein TERG_08617 [Trichophyton rubrum CBS 118892]EZF28040.1 hypothetical protein H100_00061 [Trichophyton rubrum MR850]EZF47104.1 hypothetical protein H102_00060 [Trichophyton rubrum CBS 100081]EZF57755.1 hypothetical protein H103_00062 [Trichophyton rubrum CBS 288.86]EZF68326.1 hypothetical protein H104_00060 [Trichophyton rubrum CBS 289.86]EZF78334.1 hypothetical protein H105_00621 [Trichophyton soudanense CBS 452.61]EZF89631.1 hypothetical protein H110_00060 [Trichophy
MAGQSESELNAGSEANQIEIGELSPEIKNIIAARQEWLDLTTHFEKRGDVYLNIDKTFQQEFKELIDKLGHPPSAHIRLFRTQDNNVPTIVHDSRLKRALFIYPLHLLGGHAEVHSSHPGAPGSISKELCVGSFVAFQDQVVIDGVLDFLLVGVPK